MTRHGLPDGGAIDLEDFTARFTGKSEMHNGVLIRRGRLFRVSYKGHDDLREWEWFEFRPVRRWLLEADSTRIPYSSIDTFFDNWEVVCE